jgi:hypothetical protein
MKEREILKVTYGENAITIVDNMFCVGSSDDDSDLHDTVIYWEKNGNLIVDNYEITPAMVEVLKMYLNKQL